MIKHSRSLFKWLSTALSVVISLSVFSSCKSNICQHTDIVIEDGVEATCLEDGLTEGRHCAQCNKVLVEQEVISALGHNIVVDTLVDSTCTTSGLSVGSHCDRCNKVFEEQKVIPAGHKNITFISMPVTQVDGVNNPGYFHCEACDTYFYDEVKANDIDIPILSVVGDVSNISKDNKTKLEVKYEGLDGVSFDCDATLKLQGNTSLYFPKTNYNVTLYKKDTNFEDKYKVKLVDSWGKQSKYTLKANWIDFSQLRNNVSANLYGQIVHSRNIDDRLDKLVNGGAIDGYPILMFQNGVYHGLYTLNIPKDKWLFDMNGDETSKEAILMGKGWNTSTRLREHIEDDFSNKWELEYSSTEDTDNSKWVVDSFNKMIDFLNISDEETFKQGISKYINIDRAIDSMLFTMMIHGIDNGAKNILWVTYDGVSWMPSVYDLDSVFGLWWNGDIISDTTPWIEYDENELWTKLYLFYKEELKEEYFRLRESVMSIENIINEFTLFDRLIPSFLRDSEKEKWVDIPSQTSNNIAQIETWTTEYFSNMDLYFESI